MLNLLYYKQRLMKLYHKDKIRMNYIRINKFSKTPLYEQLYNSIKAAIQNGQLKDKDKLPPEEVLADTFNISRPVKRQAYASLK